MYGSADRLRVVLILALKLIYKPHLFCACIFLFIKKKRNNILPTISYVVDVRISTWKRVGGSTLVAGSG